ncbi:hypothetical protein BDW74DRAFT_174081 [Aspergillus multicolor]|uniref:BRcat and Rcat domain-containing protein n=1 Tax=Aspergillus multicolor TaxID=41759 RepID=UPI003CCDB94C
MLCFSDLDTYKDPQPAIRCKGNSGKCNEILPLNELWDHLPSSTFEDLLEASFKIYIRRHSQQYQYCPTPDCNQVYCVTDTGVLFDRPTCLRSTCAACHVHHPGMTCEEQNNFASSGLEALANGKTKKELGAKGCPKCKTAIEKTEGCDMILCGGYGAYICWKCMETFELSEECYEHMDPGHGSIY